MTMITFPEGAKLRQQSMPAKAHLSGRTPSGLSSPLNSTFNLLQRTAANPEELGKHSANFLGHDFSRIPIHSQPSVKIRAAMTAVSNSAHGTRDKITQEDEPKADQSIGNPTMTTTARGLDISADATGLYTSKDYPDGFRWLQTVTTNDPSDTPVGAPLLPKPITYVDPRPNDDTKPFYWTDAEEAANLGHFEDKPGRPANAGGTIVWDAILSLSGVNSKTVTRFDSITYGFTVDSAGNVTASGPASPGSVAGHLAALTAEFPTWTFK